MLLLSLVNKIWSVAVLNRNLEGVDFEFHNRRNKLAFMRKLILVLFFFIVWNLAFAQPKAELGVFLGTAYYMGDINPSKHFYEAGTTTGGIYRYNFNSRYAVRAGMLFSKLKGSDFDFENNYQQNRGAYFETDVVDLSVQLEFNFQPFWTPKVSKTKKLAPYVTLGIGYIAPGSTESSLTIPMGVGFKYALGRRWSASLEWSFKKTFTDGLDALADPNQLNQSNMMHNNDWASFCGIIIAYKLFDETGKCHAYDRFVK